MDPKLISRDALVPTPVPPVGRGTLTTLQKWIESEFAFVRMQNQVNSSIYHQYARRKKISMLRRTTVAYGMAELFRHILENDISTPITTTKEQIFSIDNFAVRVLDFTDEIVDPGWEVEGVEMDTPHLSLRIIAPSFSGALFDKGNNDEMVGKKVDVEISVRKYEEGFSLFQNRGSEMRFCHLFGRLLNDIFSPSIRHKFNNVTELDIGGTIPKAKCWEKSQNCAASPFGEFVCKKKQSLTDLCPQNFEEGEIFLNSVRKKSTHQEQEAISSLLDLGFSSCVWDMVKNFSASGLTGLCPDEAYSSIQSACEDIRLLLLDPERFLYHDELKAAPGNSDHAKTPLRIPKNKLYGREKEISIISDSFCRVATTGVCEAFLIRGWSGCGKSSLVATTFEPIRVAGGYVVSRKFEEISSVNPVWTVMAAFNDLCILIKERNSDEELLEIQDELIRVFGINLPKLVRILPNAKDIFSTQASTLHLYRKVDSELTFKGLCFAIQCFMSVISAKSRPIMIFLDDLQWADNMALGLIHAALSDASKITGIFFVGGYRNNEIQEDHAIFSFIDNLESYQIGTTKLDLDGMEEQDVNMMISDALAVFPRNCRALSSALFQKTRGNPLFVIELLESLVKRKIIQYSLRKRRWVWDDAEVSGEEIAENVLHLLTTKMTALPPGTLEALKVASCFGSQISHLTVELLCKSPCYEGLKVALDEAIQEGFLERVRSSEQTFDMTSAKFRHDKIREAAYGRIGANERVRYHHDIGMALYSNIPGFDADANVMLFTTVGQLNRGISLILEYPSEMRISIAEMNCKAGMKAIECSNFESAYKYLKAGIMLLPDGSWNYHQTLCVELYSLLSRAAYALGILDDAFQASKMIIENIKMIEDKLDIYTLYIKILFAQDDAVKAFNTCRWVLRRLGENVPPPEVVEDIGVHATVKTTYSMYIGFSTSELLGMEESKNPIHIAIMNFYRELIFVSFKVITKQLIYYYICRWAQYNSTNGFCRHTPECLASFACALNDWFDFSRESYKIGKVAVDLMKKYDVVSDCAPFVYLAVYSSVALLVEPYQSCADMLQRGYEFSMSKGDIDLASRNLVLMVQNLYFGGTKLSVLKKNISSRINLETQRSHQILLPFWLIFEDTVFTLIGDQEMLSPNIEADLTEGGTVSSDYLDFLCHQRMQSSYWLGHYDRAKYYAERKIRQGLLKFKSIVSEFYFGLTAIKIFQRKGKKVWINRTEKSIASMKKAAENSEWNFQNKVYLLEAELSSVSKHIDNDEALEKYNKAIEAAKRSKFIHEEGLACELAGFHCNRVGDKTNALNFLSRAKECYNEWGSRMKVKFIDNEIQQINNTAS